MTQAQDYVIDTGHGQVAEGVYEIAHINIDTDRLPILCEHPRVLDLDLRTARALAVANISTLQELSTMTWDDLLKVRGIGRWGARQIVRQMEEYGLRVHKQRPLMKSPPTGQLITGAGL